ncbi:hypothetical protein BJV82DRAFT_336647 [Fennellomyces sp. T-0311]|nr:hypothetical protein BJV82DRAFT_336647 [Fennellomyces sp. T-0311]
MFGQTPQTTNTFGGGFGSGGSGSGHQRTTTSLFAPASGTPSTGLFGSTSAPTSTASTTALGGTSTFGGNAGFGSTTSGFGSNTTATTSTAGGTGLFGSTTSAAGTSNPTSTFSFGNTNTTGNTSFGGTSGFKLGGTTTTQPAFGTKPAFGGTSSLFGNQQQTQQQQQQQPDSLLSLHASFPDTNVPHFIVKPDKVTRTAIPPSLFNKNDQSTKAVQHEVMATTTTKAYGEQRSVLPGFLTSATAPVSVLSQARPKARI